jgi:excisionase family DNA binding protein
MDERSLLLKPSEAAELLGVGRMRVYELIQQNGIPTIRVGRRVRIPADGLRRWVQLETRAANAGNR